MAPTPTDILFVVDNSGSMADEQENLAQNFDQFIQQIAGAGDYRIAVVTTDLRLNEPRYVALPGILRAKSKPLTVTTLAELGVTPEHRTRTYGLSAPPRRSRGTRVADVAELVRRLREEARVL